MLNGATVFLVLVLMIAMLVGGVIIKANDIQTDQIGQCNDQRQLAVEENLALQLKIQQQDKIISVLSQQLADAQQRSLQGGGYKNPATDGSAQPPAPDAQQEPQSWWQILTVALVGLICMAVIFYARMLGSR